MSKIRGKTFFLTSFPSAQTDRLLVKHSAGYSELISAVKQSESAKQSKERQRENTRGKCRVEPTSAQCETNATQG